MEDEEGGAQRQLLSLYTVNYTHTLEHLHRRLELHWKPHKPCSVYVCVCAAAGPLGPVARSDSHTHISPPRLQLNAAQAGWVRGWWMPADRAGHTQRVEDVP